MAVVDDLTVSTHHVVWSQADVQQRRVVLGLPGVQVDGRLVLPVGRGEQKPPFYTCGVKTTSHASLFRQGGEFSENRHKITPEKFDGRS